MQGGPVGLGRRHSGVARSRRSVYNQSTTPQPSEPPTIKSVGRPSISTTSRRSSPGVEQVPGTAKAMVHSAHPPCDSSSKLLLLSSS